MFLWTNLKHCFPSRPLSLGVWLPTCTELFPVPLPSGSSSSSSLEPCTCSCRCWVTCSKNSSMAEHTKEQDPHSHWSPRFSFRGPFPGGDMAFILEQGEEIQSCKIVVRCCWRQMAACWRVSRYSSVSCALVSKEGPAVSQALEAVCFPGKRQYWAHDKH